MLGVFEVAACQNILLIARYRKTSTFAIAFKKVLLNGEIFPLDFFVFFRESHELNTLLGEQMRQLLHHGYPFPVLQFPVHFIQHPYLAIGKNQVKNLFLSRADKMGDDIRINQDSPLHLIEILNRKNLRPNHEAVRSSDSAK